MPLNTMEDLYEVKFLDSIQKNGELQGQIVFLKAKNSKSEELLKVGQDKELKLSKQLSDLILENDKHQKDLEQKTKEYQIALSKNQLKLEKYIADVGNMQEEVKITKQKNELLESDLNTTTIKYNNLQQEFEGLKKRYELCEEKVRYCVANHSDANESSSGSISASAPALSQASKIPPPPPRRTSLVDSQVKELNEEIERLKEENNEKDKTIDSLQAIIEDLTMKLQNYADQTDELLKKSEKPKVNQLLVAKKNVEHAVKAVEERKTQFQEIRRYDVIPKHAAIITITCCLYLLNHLDDSFLENSALTQGQWNYIRNFFKYSLVVEISAYNILDKLDSDDVAERINLIRDKVQQCNGKEVYSASSAIGAIYDWMKGLIGLYDTAKNEKELTS